MDPELVSELAFGKPGEEFVLEGEPTYTVVANTQVDESRWESIHELVFTVTGTEGFWRCEYRLGLTEMQETTWDEYTYPCVRVEPYEKTIIKYRPYGQKASQ